MAKKVFEEWLKEKHGLRSSTTIAIMVCSQQKNSVRVAKRRIKNNIFWSWYSTPKCQSRTCYSDHYVDGSHVHASCVNPLDRAYSG